jgi:hypothetical protein
VTLDGKSQRDMLIELDAKVDHITLDMQVIRNALGLEPGQEPLPRRVRSLEAWRDKVLALIAVGGLLLLLLQGWLLVRPYLPGFPP